MSGSRPPSRLEPLDKGFYSEMLNEDFTADGIDNQPEITQNLQVNFYYHDHVTYQPYISKFIFLVASCVFRNDT